MTQHIIGGIDTADWTEEQRAELVRALDDAENAVSAKRAAEQRAPREIIDQKRREACAAKRAADLAERERIADGVFAKAVDEWGAERVGRLRTVDGSVILRSLTGDEVDRSLARSVDGLSRLDHAKLARAEVRGLVLHPAPAALDAMVSRFPGLWTELFFLRDLLTSGVRADLEKKD